MKSAQNKSIKEMKLYGGKALKVFWDTYHYVVVAGVCWQDGNSCEETQRGLKAGLVVAAQKHQVQSSSIAPWERREFASMQRKVPFA